GPPVDARVVHQWVERVGMGWTRGWPGHVVDPPGTTPNPLTSSDACEFRGSTCWPSGPQERRRNQRSEHGEHRDRGDGAEEHVDERGGGAVNEKREPCPCAARGAQRRTAESIGHGDRMMKGPRERC